MEPTALMLSRPASHAVWDSRPWARAAIGMPVAALAAVGFGLVARRLTATSRRLRSVLDTMRDAFFVYSAVRDPTGEIVDFRCDYANDAAGRLTGRRVGAVVGTSLHETLPCLENGELARLHRLLRNGTPHEFERRFGDRVLEFRAVRLGDGFAVTARDVTEQRAAEDRLRDATTELERSNERLAEYADLASHELSEPLATAARFAEALDRGREAGAETRRLVGNLQDTLDVMQDRVASLLRLAKVRRGPRRREAVDCTALVADALDALHGLVADTDAHVAVAPLPLVMGDREQLRIVFENLLSNALRFHRAGERPDVAVAARRESGAWHFTVDDQGAGIAPEDHGRIFDMFGRAGDAPAPGTGIGLAVCKAVVEGQGGRIWVESQHGRGSTFHFTLLTGSTRVSELDAA